MQYIPQRKNIYNVIISMSPAACCCGKLPFLCPHFHSQSGKSGFTASFFTRGGSLFSNPLSMCWSGRMYLLFDQLWCRGCRPVSSAIFLLTHPSDSHTVPTCTCFPGPFLFVCTRPANPVAILVLVWKLTSSKYGSIPRGL